MRALIFSAVLSVISNNAFASWSLLENSTKSSFSIYIEKNSIKKTGLSPVKDWFLLEFKHQKKFA